MANVRTSIDVVSALDPRGRWLLDDRGEDNVTGLEAFLAIAGLVVTVLVVTGMILITPRGGVPLDGEVRDPQGADLSRPPTPEPETRPSGASAVASPRRPEGGIAR